jgi:O-acetylserine/cysteine efflux transporter
MRTGTLLALAASGLLWGTTVPLTKVAVADIGPAWLTVARLTLAGLPLAVLCCAATGRWAFGCAATGRWAFGQGGEPGLRAALDPAVVAWGALGYGAVFTLQNEGVSRTSVSHAALLVGTVPILVAVLAAVHRRASAPSRKGAAGAGTWVGLAVALAGVVWIGVDGGGTADPRGDALVLGSLLLNAAFLVAQPALLAARDPLAVTAVQLLAGAVVALPVALVTDGAPRSVPAAPPIAALAALAVGGTLVPYALFTWAQARTSAEVAGAFLNLEPLVGALLGALAFGDPAGPAQLAGAAAILAGVTLAAVPRVLWPGRATAEVSAPPRPVGLRSRAPARATAGCEGCGGRPAWRSRQASRPACARRPVGPAGG